MTEDERLYLQFIQNNISRMNTNSSQVKGWCIAIVAALLAIYADKNNPLFIWFCFFPIIMFCFLDAFYLQQEHKFRRIYDDYVEGKENKPQVYKMPVKLYEKGLSGFLRALKSWSIWPFYLFMIFSLLMIQIISNKVIQKDTVETTKNEISITSETSEMESLSEIPIPELIIKSME